MKTVMSGDIKPHKPERMPPTLMLNEDDLPEIKDWKVGGKYTVTLQVEQTSMNKGDGMMGDGSKKLEARFKVLSASAGKAMKEEETPEEETSPDEEVPEEDYGEDGDMEDMPKGNGPHIAVVIRAVKKKLGV